MSEIAYSTDMTKNIGDLIQDVEQRNKVINGKESELVKVFREFTNRINAVIKEKGYKISEPNVYYPITENRPYPHSVTFTMRPLESQGRHRRLNIEINLRENFLTGGIDLPRIIPYKEDFMESSRILKRQGEVYPITNASSPTLKDIVSWPLSMKNPEASILKAIEEFETEVFPNIKK